MYAKSGVKSGSGQSWWTIIENGLIGRWTIRENRLYKASSYWHWAVILLGRRLEVFRRHLLLSACKFLMDLSVIHIWRVNKHEWIHIILYMLQSWISNLWLVCKSSNMIISWSVGFKASPVYTKSKQSMSQHVQLENGHGPAPACTCARWLSTSWTWSMVLHVYW